MDNQLSFHAVAARLSMKKSELEDRLSKLNIYECSGDLPCPEFFTHEGYFTEVEDFDHEAGQFWRLLFTEKGFEAFETIIKKEFNL